MHCHCPKHHQCTTNCNIVNEQNKKKYFDGLSNKYLQIYLNLIKFNCNLSTSPLNNETKTF